MQFHIFIIILTGEIMKKICVFCGSSKGVNPIYAQSAEKLGQILAENSIELVYGGGNVGLMGILSQAVMQNGGRVTGIIPEKLNNSVPHDVITELRVVDHMHDRKSLMHELSEGFICLPGGIGSLEEMFEAFTWLQLGYHEKPVCLLNINGYYSGILQQLDHMVEEGFLKDKHREGLIVTESLDGIIDKIKNYVNHYTGKWQ